MTDKEIEMLLDKSKQVLGEIWKNYKHCISAYGSADPDKFFETWDDELDVLYNAYKDDHVRCTLFYFLSEGLRMATEKGGLKDERNA